MRPPLVLLAGDAGNANSDDDDPAMPLQRLTMMQVLVLRGR
jgi:hypothetical protein